MTQSDRSSLPWPWLLLIPCLATGLGSWVFGGKTWAPAWDTLLALANVVTWSTALVVGVTAAVKGRTLPGCATVIALAGALAAYAWLLWILVFYYLL
jgi:hypothetical protein